MSLEKKITLLRSFPVPSNEESAKAQFIQPILRLLGWPSDDPDRVFFEYGAGSGRVDIALKTDDRFVAFVEAKAPGKNLANHVSQMLRYAFHEGVDICALTTGLEWWLYLPREAGPPAARRFAVLNVGKGSAQECAQLLRRYLGRRALADRSAERSAKEALNVLREEERLQSVVPKVWEEMQSGSDPELLALIRKRVREKSGPEATTAQVARALGWSTGEDGAKRAASRVGPEPRPVPPKRKPGKRPTRRPTSYELWGELNPVKTWQDVLLGVAEAVLKRHESTFLRTARPLWGKRGPWVSANRDELRTARPIGQSGLYVEANLSAKDIERRCCRLLKAFGYPASDLRIRHD